MIIEYEKHVETCCVFWIQAVGSKTEPDRWWWSPCCWSESWCSSTMRTTSTYGRRTRDQNKKRLEDKSCWGDSKTTWSSVCRMNLGESHSTPYRPFCNVTTFQRSDEKEESDICKRSKECLNYSWKPYLQSKAEQYEWNRVTVWPVHLYRFVYIRKYMNLPGDELSRSQWSITSCIWMQRGADRWILLFLPSIPRSRSHRWHS